MSASMRSVFASWPVARAKSRTWRGFITTTGNPTAANAATTARSYPPVASSTTRVGMSRWSRSDRPRSSASSLRRRQRSPPGRAATTSSAFETSMPMKHSRGVMSAPPPDGDDDLAPPCGCGFAPTQLFGLRSPGGQRSRYRSVWVTIRRSSCCPPPSESYGLYAPHRRIGRYKEALDGVPLR